MKTSRTLLACAALFVLALAWGAVVQPVLLPAAPDRGAEQPPV